MTTSEPLQKVSAKRLERHESVDPSPRESVLWGQHIQEGGLVMIWAPEDQARCIPVRWLASLSREVPVARNEDEH